ncbi:ABC transporter substrate-binding protein [Kitasatospora sp. NPDC049285]|uniref:ABC transporter substrate-binding protein n=1 Tax=Kitasatospora sp. NPDC049285 TaxID=3157096 RepID=UPI003420D7DA
MAYNTRRGRTALAAALGGALLLAGCGSGGSDGGGDLHAQLPDAVRKAGTLTVGTSFTAAPVVFRNDQGDPDGLDPDLAKALEQILGIKIQFQDVGPFANVLPGLLDRKFDIAMSGITDTREREEGLDKDGKQANPGVDFVDYFMAGIGIAVHQGNPKSIASIDDLCGHTVTVKKGTTHDDLALRQAKACDHLGKPLKVIETGTDNEAIENLKTAADAYVTDYPKAQYAAQTVNAGNSFQIGGPQIQPRPFGIALRKDDQALRDVLMKAVNRLVLNGTYDQILTKHHLTVGAIQNSVINGST